ncbi:MAG: PQQ-binding-like beta-propeller repeat protein, partial [Planctomycetes bacterium]|nr:PQQ-binding-like beta-propeller repeat protein [Planctomycetota bacterium]
PVQSQRRLAAIGEKVYCTPGYAAPITVLDAATGKVLKTFAGTERTMEFVFDDGTLFAVIGDQTDTLGIAQGGPLRDSEFPARTYGPRIRVTEKPKNTIIAIDAESGRVLWRIGQAATDGYQGGSLAVRGQFVAYATAKELVCVDRTTGRQRWRTPAPIVLQDRIGIGGAGVSLVLSDQAAYLADSQRIRAFSLSDGSELWQGEAVLNHHKPPDVFLADGLVWSAYFDGHDPLTGKIVKRLTQKMTGPMGHDRCYRNRITERFYINTKTGGSDFIAFDGSVEFPNPWVRSTCGIGHLPCNGLLYCGPPACSCCNWVMLNAMNALAPEPGLKSSAQPIPVARQVRLEKGPAYGAAASDASRPAPDDWPTYRHDPGRTGVTKAKAPAKLKPLWQAKLSTRASAPVVAAGKVFVAEVDAHAVCALDAADGRLLWRYTTGGRVDSPPTFYCGLVLFGSHDGWVYCLRASDGVLAWRFRELPDRRICAYEQVESAWPVCGSVLVKDGVAYFAAGRNSFLDGGIFVYGLNAKTGEVLYRQHLYGPYGPDGFPIITSRISSGVGIDGCKTDILLTDGKFLYMRHQAFRADLTPLKPEDPRPPHLIPSPGFLESIPHHRTFWTIDRVIRYDIPAGHQAAHGDILVLDGQQFYEVRGYTPARISPFDPRQKGYTVFAGVYREVDKTLVQKRGRKGRKRRPRRLRIRSVAEERWTASIPLAGKALVLADQTVFVAGTPVAFPPDDLWAAYEGRLGGVLCALSAATGEKLGEVRLDAPPTWDGMAVAGGRLFVALQDGRVLCFGSQ